MRKRVWIPLATLMSLAIAAAAAWYTYPWQSVNPDFLFRLLALSDRYQLTPEEKQVAVRIVQEAIQNHGQPEAPADAPRDVPEKLTQRDPREVWVSLYLPPLKTSARASDSSLYRSLKQATRKALDAARDRQRWLEHTDSIAIQIDVLQDREKLVTLAEPFLFFALEPGVDGLILTRGKKVHYQLPADVMTRGLLTPRKNGRLQCIRTMMEQASKDLGARRKAWQDDPEIQIERFRTISFGVPVPGKGLQTFFRGNVLIQDSEVTAERIYSSIQDGARWLLENAKEDGKFNYQYYPNSDQYPRSYNAVRHAGTVYGLLELYRNFQEPEFLEAARKATPYLYENIKQPGKEKDLLGLPDGKNFPTGAAALGLLAFVNMPPEIRPPEFRQYEEGLGRFLLKMIDDRGAVFEGYRAYQGAKNGRVRSEPVYYPGESMLALAKLYEQTKDPRWLEGAEHIADRQITLFNRGMMADHWVIQGLYQLYRHTGDTGYGRAALHMADSYIETQCPPNTPPFPDYFGAWRRDNETPRTTRAGSRSEAMTAAVRAAWEMKVDARRYEDSLLFAAKHQIEQQFRPENAFFLPRPERAVGGYRAGLIDNHLRIDFNQHSAVGLIGALEVAVKREKKQPWWKELPIAPADAPSGADAASSVKTPAPIPAEQEASSSDRAPSPAAHHEAPGASADAPR